jgi:polar amino acid transport system substrate-binding protein
MWAWYDIERSALVGVFLIVATPTLADPSQPLGIELPADIKSRGKLIVGVKCDFPPIGYVDAAGKNVGFEIDVVRQLTTYAFGKPDAVDLECVSGPNRVPYITSGRVDAIVSVLSWTPDRAKVIGFSKPYLLSGIQMIVPKASPIKGWADIKGKTVTTTSGGTQNIWLNKCMPDVKQTLFDNTADSLATLKQGRAEAFPQDLTLLVGIVAKDPSLKIVGESVARGPIGIGVKFGNQPLIDWLDAAIADMAKDDFFWTALAKWVPKDDLGPFEGAVPRPKSPAFSYAGAEDIYKCN